MSKSEVGSPLEVLVLCARQRTMARIVYLKHAERGDNPLRVIEPYSFTEGRQDVMVKAYQIRPKEGWRFFMVHKLDSAEDSRLPFAARRKITLPDGEVSTKYREVPRPEWSQESRREYRDLVSDCLADGEVTPPERQRILDFVARSGLVAGDVRFVHASIYHRVLGAVLDDAMVAADEIEELAYVERVLRALGWCPGDVPVGAL